MSPIKGITDQLRLPRLGKIRLGIKVEPEGKASYPRATNYFVCPPEVQEVFGKEPTSLRITFPTDNPEMWAGHWYRAYTTYRGLVCKGDGDTANRMVDLDKVVDAKTGSLPDDLHPKFWPMASRDSANTAMREIQCPGRECPQFQSKQCKPMMNLQFLLPEVEGAGGIWQIDTNSWNSIRNVLSGVTLIEALCGRTGLIPLSLSLVPMEVQPEGQGKKTVHVLQLTAPYKLADLFRYAALPRGQAILALPAPDDDEPPDLFSEEEPTTPAVEVTVDDFFQPQADAEERRAAWTAVRDVIRKDTTGNFSKAKVVAWLSTNETISLPEQMLDAEDPPATDRLPTPALARLRTAISHGQMRLGTS